MKTRFPVKTLASRFLLILLPLMITNCSWTVDTDLAELSVEKFHESYNQGSYDTIYVNASPEFQDFVTKGKFNILLNKLHVGLGQHQSSSLIKWSADSSLLRGTTITLVYSAVYDNDDKARESFTFKMKDGFAKLYNFNVSSKVLGKKRTTKPIDV